MTGRAKRRERKPVETLVKDEAFLVLYDPNTGLVSISNGFQGMTLVEADAIVLRDALLDRLA